MKLEQALCITRQNTGAHFLDSGGAYGRHHEAPPPKHPITLDYGDDPTISLSHWLAEHGEVNQAVQDLLHWHADKHPRESNFEIGQNAMEQSGWTQLARDNTYNSESDFDQCFVWEVWAKPGANVSDWVWADKEDIAVLIYAHTGCDVRGGYAEPMAVEFDGDYALPLDWCCEWYPDPDDEPTQEWQEEEGGIQDEGSCGYSGNPFCHLQQFVDEFVSFDPESQVALYKRNGRTIRLFVGMPHA